MAIQFISTAGSNPLSSQTLGIVGDGISNAMTFDLSAAPIGLVFAEDNTPSSVFVTSASPSALNPVTATINKSRVTLEFSSTLTSGQSGTVTIGFLYEGIA